MNVFVSDVVQQVYVDGELTQTHESYTGSSLMTMDVMASGVTTVMLESVYLLPDEWISLLEVCTMCLGLAPLTIERKSGLSPIHHTQLWRKQTYRWPRIVQLKCIGARKPQKFLEHVCGGKDPDMP